MTNEILFILIVLVQIILFFFIKNLLPSYFNEKGKNLATKQDVSEITGLVESVKYSFTKETEKLKSDLHLLTNLQDVLIAEERNAIIIINEKYYKWLNALLDPLASCSDTKDNEQLALAEQKIKDYYADFIISEARFSLFVDNKPFVDYVGQLQLQTMKNMGKQPFDYLLALKHNNDRISLMKQHTSIAEQSAKLEKLHEERKTHIDIFNRDIIENFKIVFPLSKDFQKMGRNHIYDLIKNKED